MIVQLDFGGGDDVVFSRQGCAGLIRLTRPSSLNSLNHQMTNAIAHAFTSWADDGDVAVVLIEGEGRAFCAGGDVVALWHGLQRGEDVTAFFAAEYRLNSLIGHFPKPCISFLDGLVMGGGAGLSMHGSHRIVTENTRFAMPEVAIGFFPDVGMGSVLARMKGCFGIYLALTGATITCGDCWQLGLATHAMRAQDYLSLRQNLINTGETKLLDKVRQFPDFDMKAAERDIIARCFCAESIIEISDRLKAESQDDFASRTLAHIQTHSPTSLHVINKQMMLARDYALDECLQLDYRLASRMVYAPDFAEGVRARLIDKDNRPYWQPAQLGEVLPEFVEGYFAPCSRELDL